MVGSNFESISISPIRPNHQVIFLHSLGPFVKKVSTTEIGVLIEQLLFSLLESEKDTQRESSSYGLKTVILKMPTKASALLLNKLVPSLVNTLTNTVCCNNFTFIPKRSKS
jgi:hypothetical protein